MIKWKEPGIRNIQDEIVEKAREFGACLAGIADVSELRRSPSHVIYSKLDSFRGIGTKESKGIAPGEFAWPQRARSIIVLAVPHPRYKPELDWWMEGCRGGDSRKPNVDLHKRRAVKVA